MKTSLKLLIGLAVLQAPLVAYTWSRPGYEQPAPLTNVLPGFDATKVTRVQIYPAAIDAAPASKPALDLVQADAAWTLASHFGYPVDGGKLADPFAGLASMRARGPITRDPARHRQLGVADDHYERKLVLRTPTGDVTVLLGGPAGTRAIAVRVLPGNEVYAVTGVGPGSWGTTPGAWVGAPYLQIAPASIAKVSVQAGSTSVELDHGSGAWAATVGGIPVVPGPGEELSTSTIDAALGVLAQVMPREPGDPAQPLGPDATTIAITVAPPAAAPAAGSGAPVASPVPTGTTLDLVKTPTGYWLHDRSKGTAIQVDASTVAPLLGLDRGKLIKKVEAAPAAPTPGGLPPGMMPAP